MERCVLFGAPGLAQPCGGEGSASDPALGSNPSSSRRWARNSSLSLRRPALEWRVRCTGRAPRVPAVGVTPFRPGGGCMGGPRGLAGLWGRAGPPASPVEFSNPLWRQRRRRLAAGRGAPLAPPSSPHSGSGVWGLARWPHLFPIWSSALCPLLRVVARVGGAFTTGPPPPHPPCIPPQDPNRTPRGRAGSVPAPLLPPCVRGARPLPANPGWEGLLLPLPRPPGFGCVGEPPALCPASSPFIRCHGHGQRRPGRGEQRGGPPSGIRLRRAGGPWAVPPRRAPLLWGGPCAPWRPLPDPPRNKTPQGGFQDPQMGLPPGPPPHFRPAAEPPPRPAPRPPRPWPRPRAERAGPRPLPSLLRALRAHQGRAAAGRAGPGPDLRAAG